MQQPPSEHVDSHERDTGNPPRRVAAIITAYHPSEQLLTAVRSVVDQVDQLVIIDDSGSSADSSDVVLHAAESLGAKVVRHASNRGIGAALNSGLQALEGDPPKFVLTLDMDSVVPAGYVDALVDTAGQADRAGIAVGMVAPAQASGVRQSRAASQQGIVLAGEPIQSGLLIPWQVLQRLGRFDESLFIDSVDSDFYLRGRAAGLKVVTATGTVLRHRLGHGLPVRVLGREFEITVAADYRYYYQVRNLVEMVRRHGRQEPRWAARAVLKESRHLVLTSVLAPGRRARLRHAVHGLRDGLGRRSGRGPVHERRSV